MMLKFLSEATLSFAVNFLLKNTNNSIIQYFYYFLYSRILKGEYVNFLKERDFPSAIRKKNEWAKFILNFSTDKYEKYVARHYLWILCKSGYVESLPTHDSVDEELKNINKISGEIFYLYGPNSNKPPNLEYKDYTLVVTKDIDENVDKFKKSILFLNSMYYRAKIKNDKFFKDMLLNKYGKIFISSMLPIEDKEFEHSKMLPCSELCGSMALGRVLYNLILKNGRIDCVIEGYDQYLSSAAYSKYYPSLTRVNNNIDERQVVQGLADHDPLYNFLIVKELSSYITCMNSSNFDDIVNMSGNQYIKELVNARNFSLLE
jgi:hypothetical protein